MESEGKTDSRTQISQIVIPTNPVTYAFYSHLIWQNRTMPKRPAVTSGFFGVEH